jgi:hypothetical protein
VGNGVEWGKEKNMIVGTPQSQTGLTLEQTLAMFQESSTQLKESSAQLKESSAQTKQRIEELSVQTKQRIEELSTEVEKTVQVVKELSKNIGGVNKSFGRLLEEMYSARLWDKFVDFGYEFTCGCQRKKFKENGQNLAEADIFLENGLYAMVVEVKTDLTTDDVDDHLERIVAIRGYMDRHGDKRFLVGAVAGGIAPESVVRYAQKKGLYVVVWSGEAATVAQAPQSFKAREWGQR